MLSDTDRLLNTVEQVLRAGQAGQRSTRLQRTQLEFSDLVQECIDLARTRHHLTAEAVRYETAGNNGNGTLVLGNADELRTAVGNLLDNAIKYSSGTIDVAVRLETGEKNLVLQVRDQGVGIAEKELKQIFKRFYRVTNRSLAQVKGTGLGLFIVRSIARKHGGKVYAQSLGEGHGTTVTLELPRSVA
jgi:two-component system, OmpR family, sensor histidine kinase SenX3